MEPLTAGALAIGTVIATKAVEKTGEKVGETLWNKTGEFPLRLYPLILGDMVYDIVSSPYKKQ